MMTVRERIKCRAFALSRESLSLSGESNQRPSVPDTRRCDGAASVPCAPQRKRAGPNSHIHVLRHTGLAPAFASGARLALRREEQERGNNQGKRQQLDPCPLGTHDKT